MKPKLVRLYKDGYRLALVVKEGDKWLHTIIPDSSGLTVTRFREDEEVVSEYFDALTSEEAVAQFLQMGRNYGMTKAVENYLTASAGSEPLPNFEFHNFMKEAL